MSYGQRWINKTLWKRCVNFYPLWYSGIYISPSYYFEMMLSNIFFFCLCCVGCLPYIDTCWVSSLLKYLMICSFQITCILLLLLLHVLHLQVNMETKASLSFRTSLSRRQLQSLSVNKLEFIVSPSKQ